MLRQAKSFLCGHRQLWTATTKLRVKLRRCKAGARIEPVNNRDDVADYCAKYVAKERSWWNVKLLGTRHPEFASFKLKND